MKQRQAPAQGPTPPRRQGQPQGGRERSVVGVNVRVQPERESTVAVGPGHGLSFWAVIVIALLAIALTGGTGHWSAGFWVSVLVLVIVGAIFPPAAIVFGGTALFYLALTHGQQFIANVSALVSPPAPASQGGQHP